MLASYWLSEVAHKSKKQLRKSSQFFGKYGIKSNTRMTHIVRRCDDRDAQ